MNSFEMQIYYKVYDPSPHHFQFIYLCASTIRTDWLNKFQQFSFEAEYNYSICTAAALCVEHLLITWSLICPFRSFLILFIMGGGFLCKLYLAFLQMFWVELTP